MMWEYLFFLSSKSSFSCGVLTFFLSFWLVGRQAIFHEKNGKIRADFTLLAY